MEDSTRTLINGEHKDKGKDKVEIGAIQEEITGLRPTTMLGEATTITGIIREPGEDNLTKEAWEVSLLEELWELVEQLEP